MEIQNEIKNKMIFTSFVSLIVIVIVLGGIVYVAQKKIPAQYQNQGKTLLRHVAETPAPTQSPVTGTMDVAQKTQKATFKRGETVSFIISADSKGDTITGYDAVLRYDPQLLTFSKATSLVEGMDLFQTDEPSEVSGKSELVVTAIQSISQKDPFIFSRTPLAEVSFVVKKAGTVPVEMVFAPGHTTDSNLMNTQTQDILSSVAGITIETR